ncbi:MAG: hypothetical protein D4S01_10405 [Dehalococcoidia bacterium]|nr:MAG: hypothetical protein D4S01_10405 [Dehalococcoidia bacterium]
MKTTAAISKKEIKDYEFYIIKKYSKASIIKKNEIVDRLIDEISKCNENGLYLDEEELSFKKLEAATIAKMLLRREIS